MNGTRPLALLSLVALLTAVIGWQATAQHSAKPVPLVVVTIRMDTLVENLEERANAKAEVDRMERDIADEQKVRQDKVTQMEDELKDMAAGPAREDLRDQIALKRLQYQSWLQGATDELEAEKALRLQDLYRKIKAEIKSMAETAGYDMVVQNDESSDLPFEPDARVPAQVQVLQQISSRKILYLKQAVDVTQDLIVRMNNSFRAAGVKAPAPVPPASNPPARKNP